MLYARLEAFARRRPLAIRYQWVDRVRVSPAVSFAVLAAEDQKFLVHHGFDFHALRAALEARGRGRPLRGASTITQQTAKNLFLWPGRSWVRKLLEIPLTILVEAVLPKSRILEIYLNIAEFGPGVYGVDAAAQAYFGKRANTLSRNEAAILAAVLPNPRRFRAERPSSYVRARAARILSQMDRLSEIGVRPPR